MKSDVRGERVQCTITIYEDQMKYLKTKPNISLHIRTILDYDMFSDLTPYQKNFMNLIYNQELVTAGKEKDYHLLHNKLKENGMFIPLLMCRWYIRDDLKIEIGD
jgi:hypothetical protein